MPRTRWTSRKPFRLCSRRFACLGAAIRLQRAAKRLRIVCSGARVACSLYASRWVLCAVSGTRRMQVEEDALAHGAWQFAWWQPGRSGENVYTKLSQRRALDRARRAMSEYAARHPSEEEHRAACRSPSSRSATAKDTGASL